MHSLIVSEIDQYLSIPCQVWSELPTNALERVLCCEICVW